MKLRFLGHQGWVVEAPDFRLLIDPILTPYFRNSVHSKVWIFPPRRIDMAALGKIDAVYFTHEHEDHFHIESIHRLPRDVTLYLSANMSGSAERILREMGFGTIRRLFAADQVQLGSELTLRLFAPARAPLERWVLQPFVVGKGFTDSFFNCVDCQVSREFVELLRARKVQELGVVCLANNNQTPRSPGNPNDLRQQGDHAGLDFDPARVLSIHLPLGTLPRMRCLAIVGGGFIEETAPFGTFLGGSQRRLAELMQDFSHGRVAIVGPEPGEWLEVTPESVAFHREDALGFAGPSAAAERALADAETLARQYEPGRPYEPVTRQRGLVPADRSALVRALSDLAARLRCHPMHTEMVQQALARTPDGSVLPYGEGRLLLTLLDDAGSLVFEYRPAHSDFFELHRAPSGPVTDLYPFGFECWGSDLLALCRGELSVYELIKHRHRGWAPQQVYTGRFNFAGTLDDLFAPEVCPETTYRLYRGAYDRCLQAASTDLDPATNLSTLLESGE